MNSTNVPVTIEILDKEYTVSCPEEEKDALMESAKELHVRMQQLRDAGKVLGAERMAVMAALNIIHECVELRHERDALVESTRSGVKRLEEKIQGAVGRRVAAEAVD